MKRARNWREMPVWKCSEVDVCGEQWAWWDNESSCPFCHCGRGERTGFDCGEVADAAEKFGFDDFPVHIPEPVPEVVQLSTLPRDAWVGLPVFHPCGQAGTVANWLLYDVGIVVEVCADTQVPGEFRCRFVQSMGSAHDTLLYSPDNLWVPKTLAQRLSPVAAG
jgi:hypothetical protein